MSLPRFLKEMEPEVALPLTGRETELAWRALHPVGHKPLLICVAKRSYALRQQRLVLADEQLPLRLVPDLELDEAGEYRTLRDDTDLLAPKEATDVVVRGHAYAYEPSHEIYVSVAAGKSARRLRVVGERRAEVSIDGKRVRFTSAEPFEKVALHYENAYGGFDEFAQAMLMPLPKHLRDRPDRPVGLYAYPRNSAAHCYFIDVDRDRADGVRLPQIEDPVDLLTPERLFVPLDTAWINAPIPGSFGWLPHQFYPRYSRLLGLDLPHDAPAHPIRETLFGDGGDLADIKTRPAANPEPPEGLTTFFGPPPLDQLQLRGPCPRAIQGASPGLACERLNGDELVILNNLWPDRPELRFNLPGEAPRFEVKLPDIAKTFTPKPVLQTLRIEPDEGRVSLTWCGAVPAAAKLEIDFLRKVDLAVSYAPI